MPEKNNINDKHIWKCANYVTMYILCIIVHYIINDYVIKTKCVYEGCVQLTYTAYTLRALHMCKCIHSAYLYSAHILHMCKKYIFGAAHITRICPILCKFFFLHICKLTLNNKLHTCKLRAKYSQQYVQNVCSIFVRELRHAVRGLHGNIVHHRH